MTGATNQDDHKGGETGPRAGRNTTRHTRRKLCTVFKLKTRPNWANDFLSEQKNQHLWLVGASSLKQRSWSLACLWRWRPPCNSTVLASVLMLSPPLKRTTSPQSGSGPLSKKKKTFQRQRSYSKSILWIIKNIPYVWNEGYPPVVSAWKHPLTRPVGVGVLCVCVCAFPYVVSSVSGGPSLTPVCRQLAFFPVVLLLHLSARRRSQRRWDDTVHLKHTARLYPQAQKAGGFPAHIWIM